MIRFTKLEEEVMNVLWNLSRAFPRVIMDSLKEPRPPYNTVLSCIRKLEKLGYIGFKKYGKTHEYYPVLDKDEYSKSIFKKFYKDLLDSSKEGLLSYFIKEEKMNIRELEALVNKIKAQETDEV